MERAWNPASFAGHGLPPGAREGMAMSLTDHNGDIQFSKLIVGQFDHMSSKVMTQEFSNHLNDLVV